jgi:hypothetical protein
MRLTDLSMRAPHGPADESVVKVGVTKKHQQVKKRVPLPPEVRGNSAFCGIPGASLRKKRSIIHSLPHSLTPSLPHSESPNAIQ